MNEPRAIQTVTSHPLAEFPFSVLTKTMRSVISDYGEAILERSSGRGCDELKSNGDFERHINRVRRQKRKDSAVDNYTDV